MDATTLADALGLAPPTAEQAAIIQAPLEPCLVIAGAGSGKTETMAARVVYLVATGQVRPEQVLGLTFTRKAAAALGQRVRRRLRMLEVSTIAGPAVRDVLQGEPEIGTYHSFGGRLIADFGPLAGIEPASTVLTPTGSWQLARRVVGRWDADLETDLGPDQVTERLLSISGALADHLSNADELAGLLNGLLQRLRWASPAPRQRGEVHSGLVDHIRRLQDRLSIVALVSAFAEAKRERSVIDFADQMQIAASLVQAHPRIGTALRERYRVVLLDEYQDTGHAQRVVLRTLFGTGSPGVNPGHPVTAVGDPVQSIYSWRGASASNLPRFVTDFPTSRGPAPIRPLQTSFRNPPAVLALANEISVPIRSGPDALVAVGELRPLAGIAAGGVGYGLFATVAHEDRWLAEIIAQRWAAPRPDPDPGPPTTAVLLRRRSDMAGTAQALRAAGLPVDVVGLGGLLDEPEIADLVATLRMLVDPTAGAAVIRVLSGGRWRLGASDLRALAQRARTLAGGGEALPAESGSSQEQVRLAVSNAVGGEDIDALSLVDALGDPGPPSAYSIAGYERLIRFAHQLRRLRGRLGQPLTDLMADMERLTGLDIEVNLHSPAGRAHLDAFADVVADVAATGAGPADLLSYLDTAVDREDGLTPGEVPASAGRVQVLTVHAAKGLEWDIVAVPHLSAGVFPIVRGSTWLGDPGQLPPDLRGDRADLPALSLPAEGNQKELADALAEHAEAFARLRLAEERRLLYVALTRAHHELLVSAHHWGATGSKPAGPSKFFMECAQVLSTDGAEPAEWACPPDDGEPNPILSAPGSASWPIDPLGNRRPDLETGARMVFDAINAGAADVAGDRPGTVDEDVGGDAGADPRGWGADVATLLAERRSGQVEQVEVELPGTVSVSTMVELADDPQQLARRLVRPVPAEPAPQLRRGTAFHQWLERFFRGEALVDVQDLPGAGDGGAGLDPQLDDLRRQFLASDWALRVPVEIEVPFATRVAGIGVRGRIDAVFADPDGGLTVVDWKTGRPPSPDRQAVVAVQLACYRLAMCELTGRPLADVRAAFHYVPDGVTIAPVDLLDADGIGRLLTVHSAEVSEVDPV